MVPWTKEMSCLFREASENATSAVQFIVYCAFFCVAISTTILQRQSQHPRWGAQTGLHKP